MIDRVYDLPYEITYLYEKVGTSSLNTNMSGIKERLWFDHGKTSISITLFHNESEALKHLNSSKKLESPIYLQEGSGFNQYYVSYLKQGRADGLGLYLPMQVYYCSAGVLKNNLFISFSSFLSSKSDASMNEAINHVGSILKAEFEKSKV